MSNFDRVDHEEFINKNSREDKNKPIKDGNSLTRTLYQLIYQIQQESYKNDQGKRIGKISGANIEQEEILRMGNKVADG